MSRGTCIAVSAVTSVIAIGFFATMLGGSIKSLDTNQVAIVYDVNARTFNGIKGPGGMYAGPPGFEWISFSAVYKPVDVDVNCVTRDGLPVTLEVAYQYAPRHEALYDIALKYRDQDAYDDIVQTVALSAIQLSCTAFNVNEYQNTRPVIQTHIGKAIETNLAAIGSDGLSTQLVNVDMPAPWNHAVSEKQQAQQDIQLSLNQRNESLYQAQLNMSLALQDAQIIRQTMESNVTAIRTAAQQNATAIAKQLTSLKDTLTTMISEYGISDVQDLVKLLENRFVRNTERVDLVLNPYTG